MQTHVTRQVPALLPPNCSINAVNSIYSLWPELNHVYDYVSMASQLECNWNYWVLQLYITQRQLAQVHYVQFSCSFTLLSECCNNNPLLPELQPRPGTPRNQCGKCSNSPLPLLFQQSTIEWNEKVTTVRQLPVWVGSCCWTAVRDVGYWYQLKVYYARTCAHALLRNCSLGQTGTQVVIVE